MVQSTSYEELYRTGREHLKAGRARDALQSFELARAMNDVDPALFDSMASAHCVLNEFEAAVQHYERATQLDARRGPCWVNLGALYNRLGKHQKAAEVLRRAVQIERKNSVGFYNLGIAYKQLKQWHMAVPAYREAIRIDPKMADAHLNLGNVYIEMGNFAQAITHFKKALEIDPKMERAQRALHKAEQRKDATLQGAKNPFGRLVGAAADEAVASEQPPAGRVLTDAERIADRRMIATLVEQVGVDLGELVGCLKTRVEPSVKTLNRLLTHRASPHGETTTKGEAFENFAEAHKAFSPRVQKFRRALEQLRDHEAHLK